MKKQVNQQSLLELRESLTEYANRTDHAGMLILAQIAEALTVKQAQDEKAKGPLWIRTHGAEFAVPVEVTTLVDAGVMFDVSYRNDSCPSFCNKDVDGDNYPAGVRVLWVDHPSAYSRETEGMNRYGVTSMEDGHTILETLYDGDDINAALRVMFPPPTIEQLGDKFAAILKEWLTVEQWTEMRRLNASETSGYVCHSHDHCDANEAMALAFKSFGLATTADLSENPDSPAYIESQNRWNAAWNYAKAKHLTRPEWVPPTPEQWLAIDEEFERRGYKTSLEGGGAACPFIDIELADGTVYLFGDVNETWSADHYQNREAQENGDPSEDGGIDTGVLTTVTDPQTIVDAFEAKLKALTVAKESKALEQVPFYQLEKGETGETLKAFKDAQSAFVDAALALSLAWEDISGGTTAKHYPQYLPDFTQFMHDLMEWRAESETELNALIALAENAATPWMPVEAYGQFYRLTNDGDLEYQPMMADGSMEPYDAEEGPGIAEPMGESEAIGKTSAILRAYLANPDAPENATLKAYFANPAAFEGEPGDALPIVCEECHIHFGDQCEHF